jgi:hypothetical protein
MNFPSAHFNLPNRDFYEWVELEKMLLNYFVPSDSALTKEFLAQVSKSNRGNPMV